LPIFAGLSNNTIALRCSWFFFASVAAIGFFFFSLFLFLSFLSRTQLGLRPLSMHFLNLHHLQLRQLFELILQFFVPQENFLYLSLFTDLLKNALQL
jgi:hypothetical protein